MVGYKPGEQQLTSWEYSAAGAASGFITRGLTQPLDVLKIRFQLQLDPIRSSSLTSKYRGMYHCAKTMVAEETFRSLWKGHVPAQILSIVYASVQFSTFEQLTKYSSQFLPSEVPSSADAASSSAPSSKLLSGPSTNAAAKLLQQFTCGGLAATAAVVVSHPSDVVRTRLASQGKLKVYKSMLHAVSLMLSREGPTSFFKGLSANLMMCVPQAAIQFGIYSLCNQVYRTTFGDADRFGLRSSSCGAVAGVCAKLAVYPFDLAKKRLQVIGFEEARRPFGATGHYSGIVHCLVSVVRLEGFFGVFKGTSWALIKSGVTSGLYFATYEASCRALLELRH